MANAEDYTDILVFTDDPDAGHHDLELQDPVITLAKSKKSKINVIWTDGTADVNPALEETCEETGGLLIESSKVDVDDIVGLLSQSIKTSEVLFQLAYTLLRVRYNI